MSLYRQGQSNEDMSLVGWKGCRIRLFAISYLHFLAGLRSRRLAPTSNIFCSKPFAFFKLWLRVSYLKFHSLKQVFAQQRL